MYYKVLKGTDTYNNLIAIKTEINRVNKEAKKLVIELGCKEWIAKKRRIAGGIGGLHFQNKPDNYKSIGKIAGKLCYFPKLQKSNHELLKKIESLPTVTYEQFNAAVNFQEQWLDLVVLFTYSAVFGIDCCIFQIDVRANYKPPVDAIEITYTEYKSIESRLKSETKQLPKIKLPVHLQQCVTNPNL